MAPDDLLPAGKAASAASLHNLQLLELQRKTYHQLAAAYHRSEQYRQMVRRYPELARSIEACRQEEGSLVPHHRASSADLHWDRSHGEG